METITYTAARANLAKTMQQVCDDHEPVIITRQQESPVVMLSLEDYQSLEETAYLLRSPKNARRLLAGCWSRRINDEHRLAYRPSEDGLEIVQLRYHY